jgi:hypothetical protein
MSISPDELLSYIQNESLLDQAVQSLNDERERALESINKDFDKRILQLRRQTRKQSKDVLEGVLHWFITRNGDKPYLFGMTPFKIPSQNDKSCKVVPVKECILYSERTGRTNYAWARDDLFFVTFPIIVRDATNSFDATFVTFLTNYNGELCIPVGALNRYRGFFVGWRVEGPGSYLRVEVYHSMADTAPGITIGCNDYSFHQGKIEQDLEEVEVVRMLEGLLYEKDANGCVRLLLKRV